MTGRLPRESQTDAGHLLLYSASPCPEAMGCCLSLCRCRSSTQGSSGALGLQTVPAAGFSPTLRTLHQPLELALHFCPLPGEREEEAGLVWALGTADIQRCSKLCKERHRD